MKEMFLKDVMRYMLSCKKIFNYVFIGNLDMGTPGNYKVFLFVVTLVMVLFVMSIGYC